MITTSTRASIQALQAQRNSALDAIADLEGVIAERNEQIAQLAAKLTETEEKLANARQPDEQGGAPAT